MADSDPRYRIWDRRNGAFWTREIMVPNRGTPLDACLVEQEALAGMFSDEEIGAMRAASLLTSWHEVRSEDPPPIARPLDGASAEARHTCRLLLWMAEGALLAHPAIQSDPEWRSEAERVVAALGSLHRTMGPDAA